MKSTLYSAALLWAFSTVTVAAETPDAPPPPAEPAAQEITIDATSYSFTPDVIVVEAGRPVVLTFHKSGFTPHDFIIDDPASGLNIKQSLHSTSVVSFTPMNKGRFEFYCGKDLPFMKSHKEKGMHGVLEVR
jgi:plastocyanin domain-containing protein